MRVKVIGAGSIGNHLSHAARSLGWSVDLIDSDPAALERTRAQIYPSRYGSWDEAIGLFRSETPQRVTTISSLSVRLPTVTCS